MEQEYQDITRPREVREEVKKLRKKFLRYQEAEVVYSISHRKLIELADRAGALYRMEGNEQYRERQMRADRMVTLIRSRYGYAAVQRGIMHEDRYLSSLNATAEDHMVHPHSYLEHGNRSGCEAVLCTEGR